MKTVLQFVNTLEFGGATDYALTLCENLNKEKFESRLASGPGSGWETRARACNEDILYLNTMKPTHTKETKNSVVGDIVALYRLYKYLKKWKIDVIHNHGSKSRLIGGLASFLAGTPRRIQSAHGFAFNSRMSKWKYFIFLQIEKLMSLLHHELVLESEYDLKMSEAKGLYGYKSCIYTGIVFDKPASTSAVSSLRNELGVASDQLMIMMVGRLTEQKDPHTFVRTALSVNDATESTVFVVVGDGDLRVSTEDLANNHERILLLGRRTDVPALINACDIYMLTSRWEGIPLTILSAMNSAKPVIATDKLGLPEVVIDNVTGFTAEEGNHVDYAAAVHRLVGSENLRSRMGRSGADLVKKRHDLGVMLDNFESLYLA